MARIAERQRGEEMAIIENGTTDYQIVTPGRLFPVENKAARDLQQALLRITGVRVPVRWGDRRITDIPTIWVGAEETEKPGLWDADTYVVEVKGKDLHLGGRFRRGIHYAVTAFLEGLGVRYFSPENVFYPRLDTVGLPQKDVVSESAFSYRHVFYPDTEIPEWALRQKLNVHDGADPRWGVNARAHSFGHSFTALIPPAKYFSSHPEFFSLVDGQRRDFRSQLCGTNPELADVVCQNIKQWMEAHPDKQIFAVAQNDCPNWCECPECAAVDEREGSHMGQVLTLVNRVAKQFPDRIIATLAYQWSVETPKTMKAADNVLIVLCHNEGCFSHGLDQCDINAPFFGRLKRWKETTDHILIWDYYVNYRHYLLPTANFRRIKNDIRLYRDLGIRNIFCQNSASTGGQFEHLRQYVQAKLLWDPDADVDALLTEWCVGMFGEKAGACVLAYINMLEDRQQKEKIHRPKFASNREYELFNSEVLKRGEGLWNTAEEVVETDAQKGRLFAARSAEMAARLVHTEGEYRLEGHALKLFPAVDGKLVDRFVRACKAANVSYLREDTGSPEDFGRDFGRTYDAIVLENAALKLIVLPEMGGRIYSCVWKRDNTELLAVPNVFESIHCAPYSDGYDFMLNRERLGPGAVEEYVCESSDANCAALETQAVNGISIRTEFRITEDGFSAKHVTTNHSDAPVSIEPVCNPAWNRTLFADDSVIRTGRETVLNPDSRKARDLFFRDQACPSGTWSIESSDGITIRSDFPAELASHTRVILQDRLLQMQNCFKKKELAPGETAEFTSSWTFLRG